MEIYVNIPIEISKRHPATLQVFQFFAYDHLPEPLQLVSATVYETAYSMILMLPDGPELTTGLRKLLEAKDCFVRTAVAYGINQRPEWPTESEQHAAHSDSEPPRQHPITNPNALEGGFGAV